MFNAAKTICMYVLSRQEQLPAGCFFLVHWPHTAVGDDAGAIKVGALSANAEAADARPGHPEILLLTVVFGAVKSNPVEADFWAYQIIPQFYLFCDTSRTRGFY